jgi:hypothetical protein
MSAEAESPGVSLWRVELHGRLSRINTPYAHLCDGAPSAVSPLSNYPQSDPLPLFNGFVSLAARQYEPRAQLICYYAILIDLRLDVQTCPPHSVLERAGKP